MTAAFWATIAVAVLWHEVALRTGQIVPDAGKTLTIYLGLGAAAAAWPAASWDRRPGRRHVLPSLVVAAAVLIVAITSELSPAMFGIALFPLLNLTVVIGVAAGGGFALGLVAVEALRYFSDLLLLSPDRILTAIVALASAVVGYGAVVLAGQMIARTRSQAAEVQRAHDELRETHEELREQNARIRDLTVAAERGRFARDMHDSLGHYLTALTMSVRDARRRLPEHGAELVAEELAQTADLVRLALAETRRAVHALRPLAVDTESLADALHALADSLRSAALDVDVDVHGHTASLEPDERTVIYRVLQEALTNVVRHSNATAVAVFLEVDAAIVLTVLDNGTGGVDAESTVTGAGLDGLRARARDIAGTLTARHTPEGFSVQLLAPRRDGAVTATPVGDTAR